MGATLDVPLTNKQGALLLAAGTQLTQSYVNNLQLRGITHVEMDTQTAVQMARKLGFQDEAFWKVVAEKLDPLLHKGQLYVSNSGTKLKDKVIFNGCKGFSKEVRTELLKNHHESAMRLDELTKKLMLGEDISPNVLTTEIASYLAELTADIDHVLLIAAHLAREKDIIQHCMRMSVLAMGIACQLELDQSNVRKVGLAGLVHDWGMHWVPAEIRNSPTPLNKIQQLEVQKHPIYSLEFLKKVTGIEPVIPLVSYQVHEAMDGSGYPRGRKDTTIHLFSRILAVADTYIAMTSPRPYRPSILPYSAVGQLLNLAKNNKLDSLVVVAFIDMYGLYPVSSFVGLNDGSVAIVIRQNPTSTTKPVVSLILDTNGNKLDFSPGNEKIIDLNDSNLEIALPVPPPGENAIEL